MHAQKMDKTEFHKARDSKHQNPDENQVIAEKIEEFKNISTYISGGYEDDASFENLESHSQGHRIWLQIKRAQSHLLPRITPSVFIPVAGRVKKCNYSEDGTIDHCREAFGKDLRVVGASFSDRSAVLD